MSSQSLEVDRDRDGEPPSRDLQKVLRRLLAKKKPDRPGSTASVARVLSAIARGESINTDEVLKIDPDERAHRFATPQDQPVLARPFAGDISLGHDRKRKWASALFLMSIAFGGVFLFMREPIGPTTETPIEIPLEVASASAAVETTPTVTVTVALEDIEAPIKRSAPRGSDEAWVIRKTVTSEPPCTELYVGGQHKGACPQKIAKKISGDLDQFSIVISSSGSERDVVGNLRGQVACGELNDADNAG